MTTLPMSESGTVATAEARMILAPFVLCRYCDSSVDSSDSMAATVPVQRSDSASASHSAPVDVAHEYTSSLIALGVAVYASASSHDSHWPYVGWYGSEISSSFFSRPAKSRIGMATLKDFLAVAGARPSSFQSRLRTSTLLVAAAATASAAATSVRMFPVLRTRASARGGRTVCAGGGVEPRTHPGGAIARPPKGRGPRRGKEQRGSPRLSRDARRRHPPTACRRIARGAVRRWQRAAASCGGGAGDAGEQQQR